MKKLKTFLRLWREFHAEDVRAYFRARDRKPFWQQVREATVLYRRYRHIPTQYLKSGLFQRNAHEDIYSHLPPRMIWRLQADLNPAEASAVARDKQLFRVRMEGAGLPVVREILTVNSEGMARDADGSELSAVAAGNLLRDGDWFVKPIDGIWGRGARLLRPADDVNDFLKTARNVIVQPRIRQHPSLSDLYPHSVNTVRIDTLRQDDRWVHNGAVLKIGQGGSIVDNRSAIGLVIGIDLDTGALRGPARAKSPRGILTYERHPDTGAAFSGVVLPHWELLRATVVQAAEAMLPLRSLGWDVAITAEGVVLVEANNNWGVNILQSGCGGLANTPIGKLALEQRALRSAS